MSLESLIDAYRGDMCDFLIKEGDKDFVRLIDITLRKYYEIQNKTVISWYIDESNVIKIFI